jgi:hypothetical protein
MSEELITSIITKEALEELERYRRLLDEIIEKLEKINELTRLFSINEFNQFKFGDSHQFFSCASLSSSNEAGKSFAPSFISFSNSGNKETIFCL